MGFLDQKVTDRFAIYNGDSMEMMQALPDASIHAAIYSPPSAASITTRRTYETCRTRGTTPSSLTSTTTSCRNCGGY